jgi:hypothetical protein
MTFSGMLPSKLGRPVVGKRRSDANPLLLCVELLTPN